MDAKDTKIQELHRELASARKAVREAEAERDALRDQLEGRKDSMWWVQLKVYAQGKALNELNKRVTSLRFAGKVHEHILGRRLTRDEWKTARDAVANEAHRDRIDAEPVSV